MPGYMIHRRYGDVFQASPLPGRFFFYVAAGMCNRRVPTGHAGVQGKPAAGVSRRGVRPLPYWAWRSMRAAMSDSGTAIKAMVSR